MAQSKLQSKLLCCLCKNSCADISILHYHQMSFHSVEELSLTILTIQGFNISQINPYAHEHEANIVSTGLAIYPHFMIEQEREIVSGSTVLDQSNGTSLQWDTTSVQPNVNSDFSVENVSIDNIETESLNETKKDKNNKTEDTNIQNEIDILSEHSQNNNIRTHNASTSTFTINVASDIQQVKNTGRQLTLPSEKTKINKIHVKKSNKQGSTNLGRKQGFVQKNTGKKLSHGIKEISVPCDEQSKEQSNKIPTSEKSHDELYHNNKSKPIQGNTFLDRPTTDFEMICTGTDDESSFHDDFLTYSKLISPTNNQLQPTSHIKALITNLPNIIYEGNRKESFDYIFASPVTSFHTTNVCHDYGLVTNGMCDFINYFEPHINIGEKTFNVGCSTRYETYDKGTQADDKKGKFSSPVRRLAAVRRPKSVSSKPQVIDTTYTCQTSMSTNHTTATSSLVFDADVPENKVTLSVLNDTRFNCESCGENYETKCELEYHIIRKEQNITKARFRCERCGRKFLSNYKLHRHLRTHTMFHSCRVCSTLFFTSGALREHSTIHGSLDKTIQCLV